MSFTFRKTSTAGEFDVETEAGVVIGRVRKAVECKAKMGFGGKVGSIKKTVWKSVDLDHHPMLGSSTTRDDAAKRLAGERP